MRYREIIAETKYWFNVGTREARTVHNHADDFMEKPETYGYTKEWLDAWQDDFWGDEDGTKYQGEFGDYLHDFLLKKGWVRVDTEWEPGKAYLTARNHREARAAVKFFLDRDELPNRITIQIAPEPSGMTDHVTLTPDNVEDYIKGRPILK